MLVGIGGSSSVGLHITSGECLLGSVLPVVDRMEEELQGGSSSVDPNIPGDGCACWQGPGICAHSRPVSTTVAPGNITAIEVVFD
ncbi:hypothetical protein QCA50_004027 [Cerrena zonata]|uniref:Uncharacterized protein n=1 Tax=Cerrena zonata TaxID=2478898 RepID=A0AAW0GKE4_9APHY